MIKFLVRFELFDSFSIFNKKSGKGIEPWKCLLRQPLSTEDTVLGHFKKFEQKRGQGISSQFRLNLKGVRTFQTIRTLNVARTIWTKTLLGHLITIQMDFKRCLDFSNNSDFKLCQDNSNKKRCQGDSDTNGVSTFHHNQNKNGVRTIRTN